MKNILAIAAIAMAFTTASVTTAQSPTALAFSIGFTGTPTAADAAGAKLVIGIENARRAAADPVEDALPSTTGAEIKASYLLILSDRVTEIHESYSTQAAEKEQTDADVKTLWRNATPAQRAAAIAAMQ
jgi:hypothetical protein